MKKYNTILIILMVNNIKNRERVAKSLLRCGETRLTLECLVFADNLSIFLDSSETSAEHINQLQTQATKVSLKVFINKTDSITTNIKQTTDLRQRKIMRIKIAAI